jgi:putative polyketide hydroxylase
MSQTPVLIVGAGPVGLTTSILLSRQGIPNLIVERRDGISTLPRARGIMSRTVEIWSQFGLYDEMTAFSLPPHWTRSFLHLDTMAGELIGEMPSNCMAPGAQGENTAYDFRCAAQDQIDGMLLRCAQSYDECSIAFSTKLVAFVQDSNGVSVTVEKPSGATETLRTPWLIGADGGRSTVRELAGITCTGPTDIAHFVNNHFSADLSRWTKDREATLLWTYAKDRVGCFQPLDDKQRWMCQIRFDPSVDPFESWTPERVVRRLRDMVGDPAVEDVEFTLHSTYTYALAASIADKMREGRVLLVGDAAHRIPPAGGIGMNSGIQTAHNLCWKLAAVMKGYAPEALLDTFDPERREVAHRACEYGRVNMGYVNAIQIAKNREGQRAAVAASKQYGNWAGLDLGVHYETDSGSFVHDNVVAPEVEHPVINFVAHAKPGYRAPHIWLSDGTRRFSSVDLFERGFVLLAGADGGAWKEAARAYSGAAPLQALLVGERGDLKPEGDFEKLYGIRGDGAVLVRPDGHVAVRWTSSESDAAAALTLALNRVLRWS